MPSATDAATCELIEWHTDSSAGRLACTPSVPPARGCRFSGASGGRTFGMRSVCCPRFRQPLPSIEATRTRIWRIHGEKRRSAARRRRVSCSDGRLSRDRVSQQGACATVSASGHASALANPVTAHQSSSACALATSSSSRASTPLTVVRSRSAKCSSIAT